MRRGRAASAISRENVQGAPSVVLRGYAEVLRAKGDLLAAADYAERALAAIDPQGDPIGTATFGATLGKVRAAQGRAQEAESLFHHSVEILAASEYRIDLALTLQKYGEALRLQGKRQ